MAVYEFAALDADGRQKKGLIEGDSSRHARQLLRDQGLAPLSVASAKEANGGTSATLERLKTGRFSGSSRLSPLELALFTRQLATLIGAGLPIEEALAAVAQQNEKQKNRAMIMDVRNRVLEGRSLAVAMADFPKTFAPMYRSTVASGEQSGYLDAVLTNLASYTEERYESNRNIQMALFYPVLLLIISLLIVSGLMIYVVPDIVEVFAHTGDDLPTLTQVLISMSAFLKDYFWAVGLVIVAVVITFRWLLARDEIRLRWDRRKLSLPLIGKITRGGNASRFASTLSILTTSGVPLVDAMTIATEVVSNRALKERLTVALQRVSEGSSLRMALDSVGYFPPMMLHMVGSGEASGQLDEMLAKVAEYQQQELERFLQTLIQLLQPLMLLLMAGMVLLIVMAVLLPILNMNQLDF